MTRDDEAASRRWCVVVVEDEPYTRRVIVELLRDEEDLVAHGASTGAEALELIARVGPDVILMDLRLPDATGFDLRDQLRATPATRRIPVVAMSALGLQALDQARAAGFAAVVDKPFDADQFLALVRRIAERPVGRDELSDAG
jgi:CheY-like chemotaxis protein